MKKLIFVLVILVFTLTLQALVNMNDIIPVFPQESREAIEAHVIDGAIHFLQAKSYADLLLMEVEKSAVQSFNFSTALAHTEKAVGEIEKSIADYDKAVTLGEKAGYVTEVLEKFKTFGYDGFTFDKRLNNDIMALVKAYFIPGNIIGAYKENVGHIADILITLTIIKDKLTAGQLPDISFFWQLLQQFSRASLFGNYCTVTATEIFAQ